MLEWLQSSVQKRVTTLVLYFAVGLSVRVLEGWDIRVSQGLLEVLSTIIAVCFALMVIVVRIRGSRKPTNARKIMIPPVAMSTGFLMYVVPATHEPFRYAVYAFLVGLVFSYPLIATSKMYRVADDIYLKRSKWFVLILLALLILRMVLHSYVEKYVSLPQTGSLFFVLAFGMILPWRLAMLLRFRRLRAAPAAVDTGLSHP